MTEPSITHLAIVGPTASGKSELALGAACAFGDVEIVSVDSMQVYRGLDVGTAKPTPEERARVPHHLVDVAEPSEQWSVARFQVEARDAVAAIEARGHRALLVGGTGLYVQAVLDDLTFPGEDLDLRAELEAWTAEPGGVAAAHAELTASDPVAAGRIDPHNVRRIVRALEVIRLTGRPFSAFGPGVAAFGEPVFPVAMVGIWLPRAELARRIARRFAAMRAGGLLEEVRRLTAPGAPPLSRTARQAIGYKELLAVLEAGDAGPGPSPGASPEASLDASLDGAFDSAVRRTRAFARRQRMWFRRDPRITWLGTAGNPGGLLPALLAIWRR